MSVFKRIVIIIMLIIEEAIVCVQNNSNDYNSRGNIMSIGLK